MGRNLLHRLYDILAVADVLDCMLNCGRLRKGTLVMTMPVIVDVERALVRSCEVRWISYICFRHRSVYKSHGPDFQLQNSKFDLPICKASPVPHEHYDIRNNLLHCNLD